jgi:DUF971 family protein
MSPKPKSIKLLRSQSLLEIIWDDGREGKYPLAGLRTACPCAECRQKGNELGEPVSPKYLERQLQPGMSAGIRSMEKIGNYALRLFWDDGHAYGIYSWDYLYALCPGDAA